jgi:hypothetical protein
MFLDGHFQKAVMITRGLGICEKISLSNLRKQKKKIYPLEFKALLLTEWVGLAT